MEAAIEHEVTSKTQTSSSSSISSFVDLDTKRRLSDASQSTTSSTSNTPVTPSTPSQTTILSSNISLHQIIEHQQQMILHQQQIAEFYQQQLIRSQLHQQQQQQQQQHFAALTSTSELSTSSLSPLTYPRSLPPAPFFLTKQVVTVFCSPLLLERLVCCSLRETNIDHEYNPTLHVANCYVYCCSGFSNFLVRSYSSKPQTCEDRQQPANTNENSESFIIEFQNVRGSNAVFLSSYEKIAETLKHLSMHGSERKNIEQNISDSSLPQLSRNFLIPSVDDTMFDKSLDQNNNDNDNDITDNDLWDQQSVQALGCFANMLGTGDATDEMACSTANSVCALASSRRARRALGKRAEIGLDAWRNSVIVPQTQTQVFPSQSTPSASSLLSEPINANSGETTPCSPPVPPLPPYGSVPVAQLLWHLLNRACTPYFVSGIAATSPRVSLELITACAHALAKLAEDKRCARVLGVLHAVPRLMYAVFTTRHSAATASFRREGLKAARWILLNDLESRYAARTIQRCLDSAKLMPGVNNPQIGDECLDQCAASIIEILESKEDVH
jgi:hypothetical protein